jgi:mono/diheme cytochrome c family protein
MSGKIVSVLLSAIFVSVATPSFANHPVNVNDQVQITTGKNIYQDNCASCHGVKLQGPENPKDFGKRKPPRLDAKGHGYNHGDKSHYEQIVNGSINKAGKPIDDGMPPFGDVLSKQEIWATIAYMKSHWPKKMRMKQDQMNPGHAASHDSDHDSERSSTKGMRMPKKQKLHGH